MRNKLGYYKLNCGKSHQYCLTHKAKTVEIMRLARCYLRFISRIALALVPLILSPVQARGLEDKIVFVSKRNFTPEVFLVEGLNGRPIQLTRNMFASWPSISPDGTEVVFVSRPPAEPENIFKLNIPTRKIEKLTDDDEQDAQYTDLDWSPDGNQILFIKSVVTFNGTKNILCVMDITNRDIRHILQPDLLATIHHPSWSPDSQHILYGQLHDHGLFITDENGQNIVNVTRDYTAGMPAWSPSRSQIAYIDVIVTKPPPLNNLQIYSMNLADGNVTALTSGDTADSIPLAWRPDGQKILCAIQSSFNPYDFDKGNNSSDVYVMNTDGKNMLNLTQTPEYEISASWSPDGDRIAFDKAIDERGTAIFVMNANGLNPQRLTFGPGNSMAPDWSPDGRTIAFLSNRDGANRIYTMDTAGKNVQQLTHRRRKFDGAPAWSPDGRWLAFGSGDERSWGLYLIDPHGRNESPMFRSRASQPYYWAYLRPTWSPDSQHLAFVAPWRESGANLMKIRVNGGKLTQLNTEGLKFRQSPVWSPDGNTLLFSAIKERKSIIPKAEFGLFMRNLNTSERSEFILPGFYDFLFDSDWGLRRLVWAPDGSQLMLSIGQIGIDTPQEKRLYLIDIASKTISLWMDDADVADWVRPGFVYAVNPSGKRISTWAALKESETP